jgi:hypothetical protein
LEDDELITKPLTPAQALARLRELGSVEGIAEFARLVGWERSYASRTVDRWRADGEVVCRTRPGRKTLIEPMVIVVPVVQEPVARVARVPARDVLGSITPWSATIAFLVAIGLFVVGLTINVTFAMSYAPQSVWGAVLMAMVGAAIEVLALLSPSWGRQLWCRGACAAAVGAWIVWPGMVVMSLMAPTGFSASTIGDVLAQRSRVAFTAAGIEDTVRRLRTERAGITEVRSTTEIERQIEQHRPLVDRDTWRATKGCLDVTIADSAKACSTIMADRQALAVAQRRDSIDIQLRAAEGALTGAGIVASIDPQGEQLSKLLAWISRGTITPTPDDIALVRLLGLTIVPSLAGLVLMFGQLLAPTHSTLQ